MKKILFALSVLTLLSYGCNRNEDAATETMQREESVNEGRVQDPSMDTPAYDESETGIDQEREEFRDRDNMDVTEPIDDRPSLDEEN